MNDLIEALTIFAKYANVRNPTHCEHDVLTIMHVNTDDPTPEERERLDALGFHWSEEYECWASFRFGSA